MSNSKKPHIDKETVLHYLQGDKRGKEAHDLERSALGDPFLADALDGLESVPAHELENDLGKLKTVRHGFIKWRLLAIAASVIVIFSFGIWAVLQQDNDQVLPVASETIIELPANEEVVVNEPSEDDKAEEVAANAPALVTLPESTQLAQEMTLRPSVNKVYPNEIVIDMEAEADLILEDNVLDEVVHEPVVVAKEADLAQHGLPAEAQRMAKSLAPAKAEIYQAQVAMLLHRSGLPMVGAKLVFTGIQDTLISANSGVINLQNNAPNTGTVSVKYGDWPISEGKVLAIGGNVTLTFDEPKGSILTIFSTQVDGFENMINSTFVHASPIGVTAVFERIIIGPVAKEKQKSERIVLLVDIAASGMATNWRIHSATNRTLANRFVTGLQEATTWQPATVNGQSSASTVAIVINLP